MPTDSTSQRRPVSFIVGGLVGGMVNGILLYVLGALVVLIIALATGQAFGLPGLPVIIGPDGGAFVVVGPLGAIGWAGAAALLGTSIGVWQIHRARSGSH